MMYRLEIPRAEIEGRMAPATSMVVRLLEASADGPNDIHYAAPTEDGTWYQYTIPRGFGTLTPIA